MSLKARLTLAFVVLLAVATAVVGLVTLRVSRNSMIDQVDAQVDAVINARPQTLGLPPGNDDERPLRVAAEVLYAADGELLNYIAAGLASDPASPPDLPDFPSAGADALLGRITTLPSEDGTTDYRVTAQVVGDGDYRVVAIPIDDVNATSSTLLVTVLIAGASVLLLGAGATWLIVRRSLEPVDSMVDTASAIAAGDLSQRVRTSGGGTEIERLGAALDEMLSQLEVGFREREESQERLKRFVADASHELRTPITAIHGYAELYAGGGIPEGESMDRAMSRIESESDRMGRLVEDLVTLARLDKRANHEREPVDVAVLARDAVADFEVVSPTRPIALTIGGRSEVMGDPQGLRQVLANLLNNVRAHTPKDTRVEVTVATDNEHPAGSDGSDNGEPSAVVLTVRDEGPGISALDQEHLFERFFRSDVSRSRATGGAGLGLAIVASIVDAHSGTISVNSAPGEGTEFAVRLPAATQVPEPAG